MNTLNRILVVLLALLALQFLATGYAIYFHSQEFFDSLPDYYGQFNVHFVKDAGLAFLSSGIMFAAAVFSKKYRPAFSIGGALFVVFHGIFHVCMLMMGMVPEGFYGSEISGVIAPALFTLLVVSAVCLVSYREEKAGKQTP